MTRLNPQLTPQLFVTEVQNLLQSLSQGPRNNREDINAIQSIMNRIWAYGKNHYKALLLDPAFKRFQQAWGYYPLPDNPDQAEMNLKYQGLAEDGRYIYEAFLEDTLGKNIDEIYFWRTINSNNRHRTGIILDWQSSPNKQGKLPISKSFKTVANWGELAEAHGELDNAGSKQRIKEHIDDLFAYRSYQHELSGKKDNNIFPLLIQCGINYQQGHYAPTTFKLYYPEKQDKSIVIEFIERDAYNPNVNHNYRNGLQEFILNSLIAAAKKIHPGFEIGLISKGNEYKGKQGQQDSNSCLFIQTDIKISELKCEQTDKIYLTGAETVKLGQLGYLYKTDIGKAGKFYDRMCKDNIRVTVTPTPLDKELEGFMPVNAQFLQVLQQQENYEQKIDTLFHGIFVKISQGNNVSWRLKNNGVLLAECRQLSNTCRPLYNVLFQTATGMLAQLNNDPTMKQIAIITAKFDILKAKYTKAQNLNHNDTQEIWSFFEKIFRALQHEGSEILSTLMTNLLNRWIKFRYEALINKYMQTTPSNPEPVWDFFKYSNQALSKLGATNAYNTLFNLYNRWKEYPWDIKLAKAIRHKQEKELSFYLDKLGTCVFSNNKQHILYDIISYIDTFQIKDEENGRILFTRENRKECYNFLAEFTTKKHICDNEAQFFESCYGLITNDMIRKYHSLKTSTETAKDLIFSNLESIDIICDKFDTIPQGSTPTELISVLQFCKKTTTSNQYFDRKITEIIDPLIEKICSKLSERDKTRILGREKNQKSPNSKMSTADTDFFDEKEGKKDEPPPPPPQPKNIPINKTNPSFFSADALNQLPPEMRNNLLEMMGTEPNPISDGKKEEKPSLPQKGETIIGKKRERHGSDASQQSGPNLGHPQAAPLQFFDTYQNLDLEKQREVDEIFNLVQNHGKKDEEKEFEPAEKKLKLE